MINNINFIQISELTQLSNNELIGYIPKMAIMVNGEHKESFSAIYKSPGLCSQDLHSDIFGSEKTINNINCQNMNALYLGGSVIINPNNFSDYILYSNFQCKNSIQLEIPPYSVIYFSGGFFHAGQLI